jgi:hypothetical protein
MLVIGKMHGLVDLRARVAQTGVDASFFFHHQKIL